MKIIKTKNYNEMSEKASEIVIKDILKNPDLTIAFATGKTPIGLYKNLVKAYQQKKISFSKIKAFNLDEYYPIRKKNKESFNYYLHKKLFNDINISKKNIVLLSGESKNWERECSNYEKNLKKNKVDLMILGVGVNGHIAFNEPNSEIDSKTRLIELKHNAVRKKALTIGISTILSAKKIVLLASGKKKEKAINCLIKSKPNKSCPVSFLKKHNNLTVIIT
jgi:glucosamine-6-phosphate deaminase